MKRTSARPVLVFFVLFAVSAALAASGLGPAPSDGAAPSLELTADAQELVLTKGLVVGLVGQYGRFAVPSDLLAWQMATGEMDAPREGLAVGKNAKGEDVAWAAVEAGKEGWVENRALSGGYLYVIVDSARPRTMILEATGFYVAWVNGEPRGGEKYGADYLRHPVRLAAGRNELLFRGERGRFKGRLYAPPADVFFLDKDMTLPDLVIGEKGPVWAGLRLVNATGERLERLEIFWRAGGREGRIGLDVTVAPLLTQKLAVPLPVDAPSVEGPVKIEVRARARAGRRTVETPPFVVELKAVPPSAHHARTFLSAIDRSVQYFGVAPMVKGQGEPDGTRPALVLSLHGAGVEAIGQARAYKPKDWAWIVAATNRRPYGFDWEDWGRLDALEVLAEASRLFGTDPDRTYLTGHSMGGHGAWQVGATVPGPWAAIAPSAGWHSFASYGGGAAYKDPSPVERMLLRANNPSETTGLARNFLHYGVYVLHGDQDDNVPVAQARYMRELLGRFHPDFAYYERPGAGHWWGNECVDWPPLFEFLKERVRPNGAQVRRVEFVTANPGLSSRSRWVEVLAQTRPLEYSNIVIERDEAGKAFKGTTENVSRLAVDLPPDATAGGAVTFDLDGSKVEAQPAPGAGRIFLERGEKDWTAAGPPAGLDRKGPHRSGGFKDAFRHGFVFVYGTRGDAAEDARALGKARFDAEMFWVRGNAGVELLPDTAFDQAKYKDRSVILYGNADTNAAWPKLLAGCPVEVRNGWARAGEKRYPGPGFAACFVRPLPGSDVASVGVVAWSGREGWVAASPGQYFISGAGFPDLLLFSAETLRSGTDGVRAVGWFGNDWSIERGDIVWNDGKLRDSGHDASTGLTPQEPVRAPAGFDPDKTIPAEAVKEDLKVLWDVLEEGHGGFDRYTPADVLKKSFEAAGNRLTGPMTEFDLYIALLPLVAGVKDGHTNLTLSPAAVAYLDAQPVHFPFGLRFLKDKAYIFRNLSSDATIKEGAELLSIGGTAVMDIVSTLLPLVPSDAGIRTARIRRLEYPATFGRLLALRFGPEASFRVRFRPLQGGDIREATVPGITAGDIIRVLRERYPATAERRPTYELSFRGATAVLTVRAFADDPDKARPRYRDFVKETFRSLEEKKAANLVIDLRGNGGGHDEYAKLLFAHVMDRPFLYYAALETKKDAYDLFRYTNESPQGREELAKQVRKNARGWFDVLGHPNSGLQRAEEPRFAGRVAILIDGGSFSATGETTSLFHYYRKAVFFGDECGSGYYGNTSGFMVMATLPNSRIRVRIPLVLYTMAVDGYPKDRGIIPDFPVTPTIEDLLAGRDVVMERALAYLKKK
jgi:dienelactone hydrolase